MQSRKIQKRYQRLHADKKKLSSADTPRSKVKAMLGTEKVSPHIRKKLLFGEVLTAQLANSYENMGTDRRKKKSFSSLIAGNIVKKYRMTCHSSVFSMRERRYVKAVTKDSHKKVTVITEYIKQQVADFFENDENSRMCPGKKDCVTKNKLKKQKRILNYTCKTLHKKFNDATDISYTIGYATFCRLRPFWVVKPKVEDRDTCKCIIHANTESVVLKLKGLGIIENGRAEDIVTELVCKKPDEKCYRRQCNLCQNNTINYNTFEGNIEVKYKKWITKTKAFLVKGVKKESRVPVKEELITTQKGLVDELENIFFNKYMIHVGNIKHQYKIIRKLKETLDENSVLIHVDFSENYSLKYAEEIQSVHFGGGREQVTLHTGVIYKKK